MVIDQEIPRCLMDKTHFGASYLYEVTAYMIYCILQASQVGKLSLEGSLQFRDM